MDDQVSISEDRAQNAMVAVTNDINVPQLEMAAFSIRIAEKPRKTSQLF